MNVRRHLLAILAATMVLASVAMRAGPAVAAASTTAIPAAPSVEPARRTAACELTTHEKLWIRESLEAWGRVSASVLRLTPVPRPPIILFDRRCEYRVAPESLGVTGRPHGGVVALPNGQDLSPTAIGFASLSTGDTAPFLVVALRSVWESDSTLVDEDWDEFLTRSFIHEMTHTRQLPVIVAKLRAAGGLVGMNDLDDDIVQETFDTSAVFRAAVAREIALLYDAALARTLSERQRLARAALRAIQARRERFYGGESAPWAFVEELLLDLEGAAEFAELSYLRLSVTYVPPIRLLDRVRGDRAFWSQDEGLALYLLLDALRPDWAGQTFTADPRTAVELIEEALPPEGARRP